MKAHIAIKTTPLVEHSKEACGVLLASIKAQNAISVNGTREKCAQMPRRPPNDAKQRGCYCELV